MTTVDLMTMTVDLMTIMIELSLEQEARLSAIAHREGLDLATLAHKLVTEHAADSNDENRAEAAELDKNHFYFVATPDEFNRALDEIAAMNRLLPVLPPEAFDRENLYEESF